MAAACITQTLAIAATWRETATTAACITRLHRATTPRTIIVEHLAFTGSRRTGGRITLMPAALISQALPLAVALWAIRISHGASPERSFVVPSRALVIRLLLRCVAFLPTRTALCVLCGDVAGDHASRHQGDHGNGVRSHGSTPSGK
jgi:hypothetical protein